MMKFFDIQTGEEQPEYSCSISTVKCEHGYLRAFDIQNKYMGYIHDGKFTRVIPSLMTYKDVIDLLSKREDPIKISLKKWELIREFLLDENNSHIKLPWEYYNAKTCALCHVYLDSDRDGDDDDCRECPLLKSGNGCMTEYETEDVMSIWETFNEYKTVENANKMIEAIEELL